MNLLLFESGRLSGSGTVVVDGRQHTHLRDTLKVSAGDSVRVGAIDGLMGTGIVIATGDETTILQVALRDEPPPPLPLTLILALPRPKMMRRILQTVASLGVKRLHLINSYRVDKSYWGTPWLREEAVREQLLLGLEQAGDTVLPQVTLHKLFKPFVEDRLPTLSAGTRKLVAHPYNAKPCPGPSGGITSLAIGPEGGFIPYEVEKLRESGFQPASLGPRILRVETALPVLLSRLF